MNVRFDHVSLSAKNPEKMRDFLVELLGLTVGTRPNLSFNGYFLFAAEKDLIHIFGQAPMGNNQIKNIAVYDQNIVHHVSFFADDYCDVMSRIENLNLDYSTSRVPDSNVVQIFVRAPENLIIEIQAVPQ